MTDTTPLDFRALCKELVELDQAKPGDYANWRQRWTDAVARANAALEAQPEPVGPTDEELIRVYQAAHQPAWERGEWYGCHVDGLRAVLDRWGNHQ